jgi:hypothetical protein
MPIILSHYAQQATKQKNGRNLHSKAQHPSSAISRTPPVPIPSTQISDKYEPNAFPTNTSNSNLDRFAFVKFLTHCRCYGSGEIERDELNPMLFNQKTITQQNKQTKTKKKKTLTGKLTGPRGWLPTCRPIPPTFLFSFFRK